MTQPEIPQPGAEEPRPADERPRLKWWYRLFLAVLFLMLVLSIIVEPLFDILVSRGAASSRQIFDLIESILLLAAIVAAYFLIESIFRPMANWSWLRPHPADRKDADETAGERFPAPSTLVTGVLLLFCAALSLGLLILVLAEPLWLQRSLRLDGETFLGELLVTMLAAAVGGTLSAILAYLSHASELKDFDNAYIPWYIARPLIGLLMGLITFFVVKAGLLIVVTDGDAQSFNEYALAGVGSLVGLFSKNAVEKLREVFHTLFASRAEAADALLARLRSSKSLEPETLSKVEKALGYE